MRVMSKDMKKVPQKKVPYAKPIPAQFQQVGVTSDLSPDPLNPTITFRAFGVLTLPLYRSRFSRNTFIAKSPF